MYVLGSSVKTAVIKATRSDPDPPKRKHVDYLVASTKSNKPNLHALLSALRSRGTLKDWKVALKVLSVMHKLVRDGDHSFAMACARTTISVAEDFTDVHTNAAAQQSTWIRIYSRYLDHKLKIVRKFEVQFEDMPEKIMEYDYPDLFLALKYMLIQLAYILEFEERMSLLDNQITLNSFALILRDSVNLFGGLLKGFLRVTEEYKEMCKNEVERAADLYEKFIDYSVRLVDSFYPKCKRFTKQLPEFEPASESMLKELDRFARDEAPERPPEGRKKRILDQRDREHSSQKKSNMKGVKQVDARGGSDDRRGAPSNDNRDRRRSRERRARTSTRRDSDVSFEEIPKSWMNPMPARSSVPSRQSGRKGKEEYDDDARSDELSRSDDGPREEVDFNNLSSRQQPQQQRPPPPQFYPSYNAPQAFANQVAAPPPQSFSPPTSGNSSVFDPFGLSSPQPQQQQQQQLFQMQPVATNNVPTYSAAAAPPPAYNAPVVPTSSALFDPFGTMSAQQTQQSSMMPQPQLQQQQQQPVMTSAQLFVPPQQQQQPQVLMSPVSPASASFSYDPFSPTNVGLMSPGTSSSLSYNTQPSRLVPASSFDPSLPAVVKTPDYGPNILDDKQFDPFRVVNL